MNVWAWLAGSAVGVAVVAYVSRLRAAPAAPAVTTTAADLAAAPRDWTDADYANFADAMRRDGANPADALLFIGNETAGSYKPSAAFRKDGLIYAAGLNQITKAGAAALGVKTADAQAYLDHLVTLSVAQQIPIVERSIAAGLRGAGVTNPPNVGVLYAVNFLPQRVRDRGTSPDTVLTVRGEGYYDGNSGLDFNKDGKITIADLSDYLETKILSLPIFRGALAKLRAATNDPTLSPRFA